MERVAINDFTNKDLQAAFAETEANHVDWLSHYEDKIVDRILNPKEEEGFTLPWANAAGLRFRPGELVLLCGRAGDGKTTLALQILLHFAATQDIKVGIQSFEMPVEETGELLSTLADPYKEKSEAWARDFVKWSREKICIYNRSGQQDPIHIIGCCAVMARDYEAKVILIDSMMMAKVSDDMEKERKFSAELVKVAHRFNVCIILVHHVRKKNAGDKTTRPTRDDIRGSGAIVDVSSTTLIYYQDRKRKLIKAKVEKGQADYADHEYLADHPDGIISVDKQRYGKFEAPIGLYQSDRRVFTASENEKVLPLEIHDGRKTL